jgi:DNA-binding SARP family transcriptional activator
MASTAALRLTLLGGFALTASDREIPIAPSGQRLVALLALHDRPLARSRVAGTLWPDCSTRRSLADLRTTLWRVNQAGEDIVTATHSSLTLSAEVDVDVSKLIALTRRLDQNAIGLSQIDFDAVALPQLTGDLLPDWYEEWVEEERESLRQTRLHALETFAAALTRCGRHAGAIQAALAAIRMEPLRETAHRTLIKAHLAEGNWSEAYRQFRECRRLFQKELGVEPSESMRQLVTAKPNLACSPRTANRAAVATRTPQPISRQR